MSDKQYSLTYATKILINSYNNELHKVNGNKKIEDWIFHKVIHTYGVLEVARRIISLEDHIKKNIEKDPSLSKIIEISALLHAIGCFYQHNEINILLNKEFEHGDYGYEYLKSLGYTDNSILLSVKYHNKLNFKDLINEEVYILASKEEKYKILNTVMLVGDAYRIQSLLYMIIDNGKNLRYLDNQSLNENYISENVLNTFLSKKIVSNEDVITFFDKIINMWSWKYYLMFDGSLSLLKNNDFDKKMIKMIEGLGLNIKQLIQLGTITV